MKFFLTYFISAITLSTCNDNSTEKINETILFVNSEKVDCTGVGPMKCLQIQENETLDLNDWQFFYGGIKGFGYQPGYIYKLLVKKERLSPESVPADASTLQYTLIKIIEKSKAKGFLLDDIWQVESINGEKIEVPEIADEDHELVLDIDLIEMKILGYDGCNNFHGTIETFENNAISLKLTGATKMMCPNMELPSNYKLALEKTKTYKIDGVQLYFYDVDGNELLKYKNAN